MNWKDRFVKLYFLSLYALTFPVVAAVLSYFEFGVESFFFVYIMLTRFYPMIFWSIVAFSGYQRKTAAEAENDNFEFKYANPWQLLLFPAQIDPSEFDQASACFRKSGLKVWQGKMTALLCALGVSGDLFDGFDDDWGRPISYYTIIQQLRTQGLWDGTIACIYFISSQNWMACALGVAAGFELVALGYFYYLEKIRFRKMPFFRDFYLRKADREPSSNNQNKSSSRVFDK